MSDFDPLLDKAYTQRLTQLGEKKEIVASEDIYNEQGLLLVKKGAPINERIADKIVRFKLIKPIESSVDIQNGVSGNDLYRDITGLIEKNSQALLIHQSTDVDLALNNLCGLYNTFPILKQKITVMHEQLPKLYYQTLWVTWLSVVIAENMNLSRDQLEACFLGALAHDFGMMHIEPTLLDKRTDLTPAEWRQIQAHTIIAKKLMENIPGINPRVALAVYEHHERCDGSGYPQGKFSDQLSLEGQVIALAESAIAVLTNRLLPNGRKLRDLMPLLQVNSESHFYDTYKALILVLKNSDLDETPTITDQTLDREIERVKIKNDRLTHMLKCMEAAISTFQDRDDQKLLLSAKTVLIQVMRIVRGSGILDEGYARWLDQVQREKLSFFYREVDDVSLMLDEIEWHLKRIKKMLDAFIERGPAQDEQLKKMIRTELQNSPDIADLANDYSIN